MDVKEQDNWAKAQSDLIQESKVSEMLGCLLASMYLQNGYGPRPEKPFIEEDIENIDLFSQ